MATSSDNTKSKFSAGLVTAIITIAWLVVFGAVMVHGIDGINQYDHIAAHTE